MSANYDELRKTESFEKFKDTKETVSALSSSMLNAKMNRQLYYEYQPLFQQPESIQRMQEILCSVTNITEPIVTTQWNLHNVFYGSAMQQIMQNLASMPRLYIDFDYSPIVMRMNSLVVSDELRTNVMAVQRMYDSISAIYNSPLLKWIQSLDFSPLFESLQGFSIPEISPEKIKGVYLSEMYDAHWFPGAIWCADIKLTLDIIDIVGGTRKSKNRVKKIDRVIYGYYTKPTIEKMKKEWRELNLPEHWMRILHQAVQAYHRKEYAITVIVLSTQWEGIIYRKAHDNGRKISKKTKEYFSTIVEQNNYLEIFKSYYDDFIMYNCNSSADTIVDVPGRHSAAHSFYESYPTRKAALNAILFTDFLLRLKPLEEEN